MDNPHTVRFSAARGAGAVRRHVVLPLVVLGAVALAPSAYAATQRADFNGDGYEDLAIGVPYDSISGDINAGAVHVLYGHPTGLTGLGNQLWLQDLAGIVRELSERGDQFGGALATGDFNGDGFSDLAIGAPGEDLGPGNSINSAGVVHVLYGSPTGLTDANDQVWDQDSPGVFGVPATWAFFGSSLAAGDFDHDGRDDLAIGVRGQEVADAYAGGVLILAGSPAGLTATGSSFLTANVVLSVGQSRDFDSFGESLASGDFNVDGFADLAIAEPGEDVHTSSTTAAIVNAGQVFVVYGSSGGLNSAASPQFQMLRQGSGFLQGAPETSDEFGSTLAAGDFNHDGRDDLAIGVPAEDIGSLHDAGAVNVVYGSSSGLSVVANQLWFQDVAGVLDASEADDAFGRALTVGDFNGDSFDDLAIGVPLESFPGVVAGDLDTAAGAVSVIYGTIQGLTAANNQLWEQNKSNIEDVREDLDYFGATLAAGDFNNDGRDDLAVGVPSEDIGGVVDAGAINVIYGTTRTGLNAGGIFPGEQPDQFWHQNVGGIADSAEPDDRLGAALASLPSASLVGAGLTGHALTIAQTCGSGCRLAGELEVANPGGMPAPASIVRFYLSADDVFDQSDTLLGESRVPAMGGAESAIVSVALPLEPGQNAQGLHVVAVLDATNAVRQVNERDNVIVSGPIQ